MQRKSMIAIGLAIIIIAAAAIVTVRIFFSNSSLLSVKIEPENINKLSIGSTFVVNITAEHCLNLNGVQVDVRFNPQVLNITYNGIIEGALLESTNPIVRPPTIEPLNGTSPPSTSLEFQAAFINLTGTGVLFSINFKVISDGSTKIQLYPYQQENVLVGTYFQIENYTSYQQIYINPLLQDASYATS